MRTRLWQWVLLTLIGAIAGAALVLDQLTFVKSSRAFSTRRLELILLCGGAAGAVGCWVARAITVMLIGRANLDAAARRRFLDIDVLTYFLLLLTLLGSIGIQFNLGLTGCVVAAFVVAKGLAIMALLPPARRREMFASLPYLAFLFFVSGFAALIYQIVWQRVLFADYGVNIESITIIVSLFMFGLGVGSMVGGILSRKFPDKAPALFLTCELLMGLFGMISLTLMHQVSNLTLFGNIFQVSAAIYALLCIPTILMGATLPILVSHLNRYYENVGKSVGMLYCINTLGSAVACFATADVLFVIGGEQLAVVVAAICNLSVGVLVFRYARRLAGRGPADGMPSASHSAGGAIR